MSIRRTASAVALPNYRILFAYADGEQRVFDMTPYLDKGIFRELQDPRVFGGVRPAFDTIEWPNGADVSPELLLRDSHPATRE